MLYLNNTCLEVVKLYAWDYDLSRMSEVYTYLLKNMLLVCNDAAPYDIDLGSEFLHYLCFVLHILQIWQSITSFLGCTYATQNTVAVLFA